MADELDAYLKQADEYYSSMITRPNTEEELWCWTFYTSYLIGLKSSTERTLCCCENVKWVIQNKAVTIENDTLTLRSKEELERKGLRTE